jgi:hypothetical protein
MSLRSLPLLLVLGSPCAPVQEERDPPTAEAPAEAPTECAYLQRRALKLDPESGSLVRADRLLELGHRYREQGIGAESLIQYRNAEALYLAGFDASTWSPEAARFALARGSMARLLRQPPEAISAYARAVVLAGGEGPQPVPGSAELDLLLAEIDAREERAAVLEAARAELVDLQRGEILRSGVDREAPTFELERFGGGELASRELAGKVVLLWFWDPKHPRSRAELDSMLRLATRWQGRSGLALLGMLLPAEGEGTEPEEAERARIATGRAVAGFPQLRAAPRTLEAFLVQDRPAAAVIDARGRFRFASAGFSPFTAAALERIAEDLLLEER